MRGVRVAIFSVILIAVFLLPLTCICSLLQVPGLYAPGPHLVIFDHHHDNVSASNPATDMLTMLNMTMSDNAAPATPPASGNSSAGCSLAGHGNLTDITPMLMATLPPALPFALSHERGYHWNEDNQAAQFSPAPATPPPSLSLV